MLSKKKSVCWQRGCVMCAECARAGAKHGIRPFPSDRPPPISWPWLPPGIKIIVDTNVNFVITFDQCDANFSSSNLQLKKSECRQAVKLLTPFT